MQNNQPRPLGEQLRELWQKMGVFTQMILILNVSNYFYQLYRGDTEMFKVVGFCTAPLLNGEQFYRLLTSSFSHANPGHIFFNMMSLIYMGVMLEPKYGSFFYGCLHLGICLLGQSLALFCMYVKVYYLPTQFGGGYKNVFVCAVGYSVVLFGLFMVSVFTLPKYQKMFGVNVYTRALPLIYMVGIFVLMPQSSLVGHFCGIIAGLMLKFMGFSILLPRFLMIREFDIKYADKIKSKLSYHEAQPALQKDFGCGLWILLLTKLGLENSFIARFCCCAGAEYEVQDTELSSVNSSGYRVGGGGQGYRVGSSMGQRVGSSEGFAPVPS